MKKVFLLILVVAFMASSGFAQVPAKPFNIYAGGGLTLPMSPDGFKDNYKMGYHLAGGLGFNAMPKVEVILNLEYHIQPVEDDAYGLSNVDGGNVNVIQAGVDGKLNLGIPMTGLNPFISGGLGLAVKSMSDMTYNDPILGEITYTEDSETKLYLQFGGGLEFNKFFIKVRYLTIPGAWKDNPDDDGEAVSMVPVTVGIKF